MRLVGVTLYGIRSVEEEEVALSPVTLLVGPNGAGKTTVLGSVAYALTGQFPGFVGSHATDLAPLARDPMRGFQVTLVGEDSDHDRSEITIERGVHRDGENFLKVAHGAKKSKGVQSAQAMLGPLVGDVQWFLDAFNPEKSIWRLSTEKRKEWALNLCAGASRWTKERLIQEMGGWAPKDGEPPDWNPNLAPEAATCLDLNLDKLKERVLAAQRVVREAKVIAEGVTADPLAETWLGPAETAYEAARQRALDCDRLLSEARGRQESLDKARRDRILLTEQIAEVRRRIDAFPPPAKPVFDTPDDDILGPEQLGVTLASLEIEVKLAREASEEAATFANDRRRDAERMAGEIAYIEREGKCHVCSTPNPPVERLREVHLHSLGRIEDAAIEAKRKLARVAELESQADLLRGQMEQLRIAREVRAHDERAYAERRAQFDSAVGAFVTSKTSLEAQLGRVPADQPDVDLSALDAAGVAAKAEEARLKGELNMIRASIGVARERKGQLEAQTAAAVRTETLKALLDRMRAVRDRMLDDVVDPLRKALKDLSMLAHGGGRWEIRREGRELEIGWTNGATFLPATSLSAGEKYRATIALLVARLMVRREPTALLFCDNLELVYPEAERVALFAGLSSVARAGFVDNILAAAACDVPDKLPGINVVRRRAQ